MIIVLCFVNLSYAQESSFDYQTEVKQLRQEINELRKLLEPSTTQQHSNNTSPPPSVEPITSSTQIEPYGSIRTNFSYQFKGNNGLFNDLEETALSYENQPEKVDMTASATRIGLNIKHKIADQTLSGKIETDFRGDSKRNLRIRHAYLEHKNWLIGQTTTNFAENSSMTNIMGFSSGIGNGAKRVPQIRYQHQLYPHIKQSVAVEMGHYKNKLPTLTYKLGYESPQKNFAFAGRALVQQTYSSQLNDSKLGWGVAIGGQYTLLPTLKVIANYAHVRGDSLFMAGANDAYVINDDQMYLNQFDNLALGINYQIHPKLNATLGYGILLEHKHTPYAHHHYLNQSTEHNRQVYQVWTNLIYQPIKPITLGIEYIQGKRKTFIGEYGEDQRLEATLRYHF